MRERWKDIEGYEGLYRVSILGRVKALYKERVNGRGGTRIYPERILKDNITSRGYKIVCFRKDNKSHWYSVHRITALTFIVNPLKLSDVNHKNGNKLDNRVKNLEWCTKSYNSKHAFLIGHQPAAFKSGKDNPMSRKVKNIKTGKIYNSIKEAYESSEKTMHLISFYKKINHDKKFNKDNYKAI